jgi:ATP-dependent Clp protease adaptor protein ClpS
MRTIAEKSVVNESRNESVEQGKSGESDQEASSAGSTGVQEKAAPAKAPAPERVDRLPPFRVLLHNDDVNDMGYVVDTICDLTPLSPHRAATVMIEAHQSGVSLLLTTHRERAELYVDQFASKNLTVTIERAD